MNDSYTFDSIAVASVMNGPLTLVVMGVTGSGKSSVGAALAAGLGGAFLDADDFHPPENVAKMASGTPLEDEDRWPWLSAVRTAADSTHRSHRIVVVACSALKESYRRELEKARHEVRFVYLKVDSETASRRLTQRLDHFMPAALVDSQFDALEEPRDAIVADATEPIEAVVADITRRLGFSTGLDADE